MHTVMNSKFKRCTIIGRGTNDASRILTLVRTLQHKSGPVSLQLSW